VTPIRIGIVDDEKLARDGLELLLADASGIEIVGRWASGRTAVAGIRRTRPDVIFLDVQMPGVNGFEVLEQLVGEPLPLVVFVTAHDAHAVRAFENNALDYLLKPFSPNRFERTLQRVRTRLTERGAASTHEALNRLLTNRRGHDADLPRLEARAGGRRVLIDIEQIDWIEARGNYVALHAGKRTALHRATIAQLVAQIGPSFVRIHRSTLLRLNALQELRNGDTLAVVADGTTLRVGRSYREQLRQRIQQNRPDHS